MTDFLLIAKVLYYLFFVLALFLYARYKYKSDKTAKFGWVAFFVFAVLFGIYSVICGPEGTEGDRYNYAVRFENINQAKYVLKDSLGLYAVESVLHLFTTNSNVLFFVISIMYFCINIYCYKKTKEATPFYLLLLFLSPFGLYGFYWLKQAPSLAFANLAYTKYLQEKKIPSVIFLIVAILFHESALIVLPCFLLAKHFGNTKAKRRAVCSTLLVIIVLFPLLSNLAVNVLGNIPWLESQLSNYVDASGSMVIDTNYFTAFKALPFYIITFAGFLFRSSVKDKIKHYDILLMLSVFCSALSLMSVYMYWMFRFATYFYVPCFILAAELYQNLKYSNNRKIFASVITLILLVLMIKLLLQYYFIYGGIV